MRLGINEQNHKKLREETGLMITSRHLRMLRWVNSVLIGIGRKEGWSGELPFYAFKCKKHGIVADYKHSHHQYLSCPECTGETK